MENKGFWWLYGTVLVASGWIAQNAHAQIANPLSSEFDTIPSFIAAIIDIVVQIGIPVVTLFIIYAGFLFVSARGDETKIKTAKDVILWTLVGAAVLLGASVLASVIEGTIDQFRG